MNEEYKKIPPILNFGKFNGVAIDKVPNSYLRWILTQDFPKEYIYWAKKKLSKNPTDKFEITITRHAIDSFSLRFLDHWISYNELNLSSVGLGSYLAKTGLEAFVNGKDISRKRHEEEEIMKEYKGIKWVFNRDGEEKIVITVM